MLRAVQARNGARGVDTSLPLSRADALAVKAAGFEFVVRYVGHPEPKYNLSKKELLDITSTGLAVIVVLYYRNHGANGATGLADAQEAVPQAVAAGYAAGGSFWTDLEFDPPFPSEADVIGYHNNVAVVARGPGYRPGPYVATTIVSRDNLAKLDADGFWKAGDMPESFSPTGIGYQMEQGLPANQRIPGTTIPFDVDIIRADERGNLPFWCIDDEATVTPTKPPVTAFAKRISAFALAHTNCSAWVNKQLYIDAVIRPADRVSVQKLSAYFPPPKPTSFSTCGLFACRCIEAAGLNDPQEDPEINREYRWGNPGANADSEFVAIRHKVYEGGTPSKSKPFREGDSVLIGPEVHQTVCTSDAVVNEDGSWTVQDVEGGQADEKGSYSAVRQFARTFVWRADGRLYLGDRYVIGVERWSECEVPDPNPAPAPLGPDPQPAPDPLPDPGPDPKPDPAPPTPAKPSDGQQPQEDGSQELERIASTLWQKIRRGGIAIGGLFATIGTWAKVHWALSLVILLTFAIVLYLVIRYDRRKNVAKAQATAKDV